MKNTYNDYSTTFLIMGKSCKIGAITLKFSEYKRGNVSCYIKFDDSPIIWGYNKEYKDYVKMEGNMGIIIDTIDTIDIENIDCKETKKYLLEVENLFNKEDCSKLFDKNQKYYLSIVL